MPPKTYRDDSGDESSSPKPKKQQTEASRHQTAASSSTDEITVKTEPRSPLPLHLEEPAENSGLDVLAHALGYKHVVNLADDGPHFNNAVTAFNQQDYSGAIRHLDQMPDPDTNKKALCLYAESLFKIGGTKQGEEAIASFTQAIAKVEKLRHHPQSTAPEINITLRFHSAGHEAIAKQQQGEAALASYNNALFGDKQIFDNEAASWNERIAAAKNLLIHYSNISKLLPADTALAGQRQLIATYQTQSDDVNASMESRGLAAYIMMVLHRDIAEAQPYNEAILSHERTISIAKRFTQPSIPVEVRLQAFYSLGSSHEHIGALQRKSAYAMINKPQQDSTSIDRAGEAANSHSAAITTFGMASVIAGDSLDAQCPIHLRMGDNYHAKFILQQRWPEITTPDARAISRQNAIKKYEFVANHPDSNVSLEHKISANNGLASIYDRIASEEARDGSLHSATPTASFMKAIAYHNATAENTSASDADRNKAHERRIATYNNLISFQKTQPSIASYNANIDSYQFILDHPQPTHTEEFRLNMEASMAAFYQYRGDHQTGQAGFDSLQQSIDRYKNMIAKTTPAYSGFFKMHNNLGISYLYKALRESPADALVTCGLAIACLKDVVKDENAAPLREKINANCYLAVAYEQQAPHQPPREAASNYTEANNCREWVIKQASTTRQEQVVHRMQIVNNYQKRSVACQGRISLEEVVNRNVTLTDLDKSLKWAVSILDYKDATTREQLQKTYSSIAHIAAYQRQESSRLLGDGVGREGGGR